jgi:hypothetical protein
MKGYFPVASAASPDTIGLLSTGELRPLAFLAEISDRNRRALAIYKPRAGEAPLWDFPDGTLCAREVAAYELSRALGWPPIPPTVLRNGPHGPGSVQLFIEFDPDRHYFNLRGGRLEPFKAVAAFDVLANNGDRKAGHCLMDQGGTIWVVDHGVCFSEDPKLRTVIWDFADQSVPSSLLSDVARVRQELRSGPLRDGLLRLLSDGELEAIRRRAAALLRSGRFPRPGTTRPIPWPPV